MNMILCAMTDDELDMLITASARHLALSIEPDWRPTIRSNLAATLRLVALVADLKLPDETAPAPVFRA
jgi:hypothetical protein